MAEKKPASKRGRRTAKPDAVKDPQTRMNELSEEMFRLRFQFATRQLTNTSRIRQVRRDIARAKTAERQQELIALEQGRQHG